MASRGSVNYCVRWDSDAPVSAALRDQIHAALKKQFAKWTAAMVDNGKGTNAWPYTTVPVNIVGLTAAPPPPAPPSTAVP